MTLAANALTARFSDTRILREVSLQVHPGEVFTVVGPSGTGKTTLLRLLALFRPPFTGSVTWNGADCWAMDESERLTVRRQFGMVFQEPSLFNATVARNASYGLRIREGWPERLRSSLRGLIGHPDPPPPVRRALEIVGLQDAIGRNALTLSGGEKQRVAFARALAVEPTVMLLDEPSSNLDPRNTAVIEHAIHRAKDRGMGVIVATHDMNQAERISDRVGVLIDGELVETGPPKQIFETPKDPRTERFVNGELLVDPNDSTILPSSGETSTEFINFGHNIRSKPFSQPPVNLDP